MGARTYRIAVASLSPNTMGVDTVRLASGTAGWNFPRPAAGQCGWSEPGRRRMPGPGDPVNH